MRKRDIAIITGASSGFGKEFVKLFADDNSIAEIWAIARNKEKLQQLTEEFGNKVKIFAIDLSKTENIKDFTNIIAEEEVNIRFLVNSAGFAKFCSYEDLNIEDSVGMIDLNISGVVAMGLVCLPYMKNGSHIINVASQASFQPLPYLNIYSATKTFVRNYSRALNVELKEKGITVTAVCPGWMDTNLFGRASIGAKKAPTRFVGLVTPDKVAKKALADAMKGKGISVYGLYTKFAHLVAKILPQAVMMKVWLRQQKLN